MEKIIKRAIEGGYTGLANPEYYAMTVVEPSFWQALGKACGWQTHGSHETRGNNLRCFRCGARWDEKGDCPKNEVRGWKIIALRFHEINLTEGWEKAVEYLISLINE